MRKEVNEREGKKLLSQESCMANDNKDDKDGEDDINSIL